MTPGGFCTPSFRPVLDLFTEVVRDAPVGSALAVWHDGRMVVDVWGGAADASGRRAWAADTLVMPYSVSKPFAAACALDLVARGRLVLDEPAARYWPELQCAATVRQILCHSAGLVALDEPTPTGAFFEWDDLCRRLAAQPPAWQPGTAVGESALFYGHLLGELVRRVDGRSLGRYLDEQICRPAALDIHIGLDPAALPRVADLVADAAFPGTNGGPLKTAALGNPPGATDTEVVNSTAWRTAEIPAVNAHATARAVAEFYARLAKGRILPAGLVREMTTVQAAGRDAVTGSDARWGLGVAVDSDGWGMGGTGGSVGWWSEDGHYAFAFLTAHLSDHQRSSALENAVRECLGLPSL